MVDIDFFSPQAGQVFLVAHALLFERQGVGTGVVEGNRITPTTPASMSINIGEGRITVETEGMDVEAAVKTLNESDATLDRMDLICRDTSGAVQVVVGEPAEIDDPFSSHDWTHYISPQPSDTIPDGVILGVVYVAHGVSAIETSDIWMFAARTLDWPTDLEDAICKRHAQGTDQFLDAGGANQVSAAQVKAATTSSHAVNKDQYLDYDGTNQLSAAQIKSIYQQCRALAFLGM